MLEDMLRRRYLVVDGQGRISRWSSGAEALLGWREQEVVGRSAFGQPLAWAGDGVALWRGYFEAVQSVRPPARASLMMLCRGGWGLTVEMIAVPVPLVLGYEFTMLVADLAVGGQGFDNAEQVAQMHPLAADAIAAALRDDSPPADAVAGLLVTMRPVSDAAVIEDTDAQHAARALAIERTERPGAAPAGSETETEAGDPEPSPDVATLRAQLELVESERDALRAELDAVPSKAAFEAARRDRDEARAALAAALAERDHAAEALADAIKERDVLHLVGSEREQHLDELRKRLEATERTAAEQRERVSAGHLATEALARERARVSELEAQIAVLSRRLDTSEAIPRSRPFEPGLDDADSPRAYIGLDGRFTALNDGFCRLVGYSEAQFSGVHWPPVIDSEHRSELRRATARLIAGDLASAEVDTVYMSGTGDLVRVLGTMRVERDETGSARRLVLDAEPLSAVMA
jgi:PAS domain S-box-containing protein